MEGGQEEEASRTRVRSPYVSTTVSPLCFLLQFLEKTYYVTFQLCWNLSCS
jgi:hypothetical protein